MSQAKNSQRLKGSAERDLVALGIAVAAIILFVATGGKVLPGAIEAIVSGGPVPDALLVNALLLNVVLVIFGWRRYRELKIEISDRRDAEDLARKLSETDPLTGCLNRRSMAKVTHDTRTRANARGLAVAYCLIDLDNFKQINDMHGHAVGDATLVELARRINQVLPKTSQLARIGGDEFAFVTDFDPHQPERVDDLVIRLFEAMAIPFDLDSVTVEATVSIGVTSDHDLGENISSSRPLPVGPDDLMHRADIAMYQAKKSGKNRYFWFEPSMESELRFRNELEVGIRAGLQAGEFEPFYEQQVDLESGELVGFEMLARWNSAHMGMVSPEVFIPVAEEIGVISQLSDQLIERALVDAQDWDDALTLSINVSPVQLRDPWFAQKLLKLLVKHNFPAQRLEVEVTESCLHDNVDMVRGIITSLRNQGVKVSLDDFGTGYSSLEQLRTLPFDRLKIDRSFVRELSSPEAKSTIVDAIVSLARGLDLPMTAEGIEDEAILAQLKAMGKLKGQGYLYGRPESAEQVRKRLAKSGQLAAHLKAKQAKRNQEPSIEPRSRQAG
ncbi:EAL domain-containing protein [Erythrobacter sp. SCSIO 43205]|uniref:putative bifunctional diguanylate cyclase/phosphodiesterase n=1 Tax=Erythrobacter sp. SCSIO 43205 TaxID=2779361 RepID=UPI001CA9CAB6|nr:EAL domain-containing protein [Erythrobacter sp. SCSIO 43205]UAB76849.1 EAL domain-containing protein [Erythrobacter sp. SCSIO 43205]